MHALRYEFNDINTRFQVYQKFFFIAYSEQDVREFDPDNYFYPCTSL